MTKIQMTKTRKPKGFHGWAEGAAVRKKHFIPYLKAKGLPFGPKGQRVLGV